MLRLDDKASVQDDEAVLKKTVLYLRMTLPLLFIVETPPEDVIGKYGPCHRFHHRKGSRDNTGIMTPLLRRFANG